jgi:hypothetical protein
MEELWSGRGSRGGAGCGGGAPAGRVRLRLLAHRRMIRGIRHLSVQNKL